MRKEELLEENEELAFENKMMAEALSLLGVKQEQVATICSGTLDELKKIIKDERGALVCQFKK